MIVCLCKNISDKHIKAELNRGSTSLCDLRRSLGVTSHCGACECEVKALIHNAIEVKPAKNTIPTLALESISLPTKSSESINSLA